MKFVRHSKLYSLRDLFIQKKKTYVACNYPEETKNEESPTYLVMYVCLMALLEASDLE